MSDFCHACGIRPATLSTPLTSGGWCAECAEADGWNTAFYPSASYAGHTGLEVGRLYCYRNGSPTPLPYHARTS